ncbi:hypothetical protein IJU85_00490 [Candidatus Saccharibacteria bacterium]|nr:hypothetical protein [Candidatus Saccharibacteria bacterium]
MLKIVVFDSGYGGELFADYLENELPVTDIIRVVDWRNADKMQHNARLTRRLAEEALKPYIGKVDLIVFANYLLSLTSLRYFQRKYKNQRFIGLALNHPANFRYRTAILTTKAVAKTLRYRIFARQIKARTCILDDWPILIDDGELGHGKIRRDLAPLISYKPEQLIFTCTQFADLERELRRIFGHNTKILNNFEPAAHDICRALRIRGALKKQK